MMFDLPHPFGPTTPTNCPGTWKLVGSTKDLNPDNLMEDRRTFSKRDGCREKPHHTICSLLYGQDSASLPALGALDLLIGPLSVTPFIVPCAPARPDFTKTATKSAITWHLLVLC
jgi:hypothetical protein